MTEIVNELKSELAEKLAQARESRGLQVETVAGKLNLAVEKIQLLESEKLQLESMTTFERGYLRNYAGFLGVDISLYENAFPDGSTVASELKSVERFRYKTPKSFKERVWGKALFYVLIALLIAGLLMLFLDNYSLSDLSNSFNQYF